MRERMIGMLLGFVGLVPMSAMPAESAQREATSKAMTVAYIGARVLDIRSGKWLEDQAILVDGERIVEVLPHTQARQRMDIRVVRAPGKYVIPGLINAHVHLATPPDRRTALKFLRRDLYSGVTAVRSMADDARSVAELARAARAQEIDSPDIVFAALFAGPGFLSDPRVQESSRGHAMGQAPWMQEVTDARQLHEAVTLARGAGAAAIKIYANLPATKVADIVREAHRQGIAAWAHAAVFPASPLETVQSGADTVSHACMLAYQAQAIPTTYHRRADVDESRFAKGMPAAMQDLFAEMQKRGTVLDATLHVYEVIEQMRARMPKGQGPPIYCSSDLAFRIAAAAHTAGVEFAVGTDANGEPDDAHSSVHRELQLLVERAGFAPLQALQAASLGGAKALNLEHDMGAITAGQRANFIFLAHNPLDDITATKSIRLVVKNGQPYWRKRTKSH